MSFFSSFCFSRWEINAFFTSWGHTSQLTPANKQNRPGCPFCQFHFSKNVTDIQCIMTSLFYQAAFLVITFVIIQFQWQISAFVWIVISRKHSRIAFARTKKKKKKKDTAISIFEFDIFESGILYNKVFFPLLKQVSAIVLVSVNFPRNVFICGLDF